MDGSFPDIGGWSCSGLWPPGGDREHLDDDVTSPDRVRVHGPPHRISPPHPTCRLHILRRLRCIHRSQVGGGCSSSKNGFKNALQAFSPILRQKSAIEL